MPHRACEGKKTPSYKIKILLKACADRIRFYFYVILFILISLWTEIKYCGFVRRNIIHDLQA